MKTPDVRNHIFLKTRQVEQPLILINVTRSLAALTFKIGLNNTAPPPRNVNG